MNITNQLESAGKLHQLFNMVPQTLGSYSDLLNQWIFSITNLSVSTNLYRSSQFLTLVLFLIFNPEKGDAQINVGNIAEIALPSIVVIETSTGSGSGVIIDGSGVVVTNFHVVENSPSISVKLNNGDSFNVISIINFDEDKDIALLKIEGFDLPAVQMGNSNSISVGNDVVVMGAPRGFEQSVTRGIVSAIRDSGAGYRLIQTDAAISPGSSGGGMFNAEGNLIGISVSYIEDAQNVNFVIPINYVRGLFSLDSQYSMSEFLALQNRPSRIATNRSSASTSSSLADLISDFESEEEVKFEYLEESDVWYIEEDAQVLFVTDLDGIVLTSVIEIDQTEFSQQQLLDLLKLSYSSNYGKVALDDDNTLVVLNESPLTSLTSEHLAIIISNLLILNDEIKVVLNNEAEPQSTGNTNDFSSSDSLATNRPSLFEDEIIRQYPKKEFLGGIFSVRFDPGRWELDVENTISIDDDFQYVGRDTWIKIIAEELELSYEHMREAILSNAQIIDPNAILTESGFRNVNNIRMMWATIDAKVTNTAITYFYHVYTGTEGTVQIIGYTTQNIFKNRIESIEEVASSFIIQP